VRDRLDYWLESRHPNLSQGYTVTSRKNPKYNCVALAAGDFKSWWEPSDEPGCYWPRENVAMRDSVENYVKVFELLHYSRCASPSLEQGFEKIAIFEDKDGQFTHIAKQLSNGAWKSKLGQCEDIEHNSLAALADDVYGLPVIYMRRRITISSRVRDLIVAFWYRSEIRCF
jgi:hypothetical protein